MVVVLKHAPILWVVMHAAVIPVILTPMKTEHSAMISMNASQIMVGVLNFVKTYLVDLNAAVMTVMTMSMAMALNVMISTNVYLITEAAHRFVLIHWVVLPVVAMMAT